MRTQLVLSAVLIGAGLVGGAYADTTTSTSGAGASVSIISGSNGGTTIVVNSQHPCRTENGGTSASGSSSSPSTSTSVGAGGLSGSATAGSGGTSVHINSGALGGSTSPSVSSGQNVASANECVIIVNGPGK